MYVCISVRWTCELCNCVYGYNVQLSNSILTDFDKTPNHRQMTKEIFVHQPLLSESDR
jgi:hypothetical protein